ncbi:TetR/AcrR family transcriptional regulator [Actinomycetospora sp. C-140]
MSSVHRARGAPPADRRLNRELVLDHAEAQIRRDGVTGFSLRALARDLDVRPAALYNHVKGRDDLLDAVTIRFLESMVIPAPSDDWSAWARAVAIELRRRMSEHPHHGDLLIARAPDVEAGPVYQARVFAGLEAAGLPRADAHLAWHVLYTVVIGTVAQQRARGADPAGTFDVVLDVALAGLALEITNGTSDRSRALHEAHRHTHLSTPGGG